MILFNNVPIPFHQFPNKETYIPKPFFEHQRADIRNVITLKYEDDSDLFKLFLVRKALWFPCDLRITYFPYSRMDRNSEEYIFTLKSVAKFINMMEWDKVIIYEPHSDVTPALLNHCKVVDVVKRLVHSYLYKPLEVGSGGAISTIQLFYPDAGAQKRYSDIFQTPNALVGLKHRDFVTGRITDYQIVGKKECDTALIVDDLCSKGGTFVLAAEKLKEMGFKKIDLIVAHCEKTIFEGKVFSSGLINYVLTTNSILDDNRGIPNLHVVSINEFK